MTPYIYQVGQLISYSCAKNSNSLLHFFWQSKGYPHTGFTTLHLNQHFAEELMKGEPQQEW